MIRKIITGCSKELYNKNIKPYVDKGYYEVDVAAVLMMLGATCLEGDSNALKDFESALEMIRWSRILGEVFGHEN